MAWNKSQQNMYLKTTTLQSHLMGEASCPSFIGGAWSGAQLMRQKIWTPLASTVVKKFYFLTQKVILSILTHYFTILHTSCVLF